MPEVVDYEARSRIGILDSRISTHEANCNERHNSIEKKLSDMAGYIYGLYGLIILGMGGLIAILAERLH